ncbi:glycosyltransferase family 2 protein [Lentisalinibacter sediminis]|uniref:glycosyltransferase family 2 protein n=1 Tax=Lentisalinibacter sediminis TaxID=2992237 RepID=UPI0038646A45
MPLADIAAVIITRDAEATLAETLASLASLPEVVVYDNGSTDGTEDIARAHENVRWFSGEFMGFGPTKNHAAGLAERDWILSIDADEAASEELIAELDALDLSDNARLFEVDRHNYLMGKRVRHAGWGNDWLPRFYHRDCHHYNEAYVHERIEPRVGTVLVRLRAPLQHRAVERLGAFLQKADRYSEMRAARSSAAKPPIMIFLRAAWAFFRTYFLRLGFLEGWRGLVIAWGEADGVFYKYMKATARQRVDAGR